MKHVLQTAASASIILAAALIIGMSPPLRAQTESTNDLPLVQTAPQFGTFWKLSSFNAAWGRFIEPPLPFNPASFYNLTDADFYLLNSNSYVLDDKLIDWPATYEAKSADLMTMSLMFGGTLFSDDSPETSESMDSAGSFPSNSLWLEITDKTRITNNWIGVTLHNTIADLAYDLLFKLSLPDTNAWTVDQQIIGSETTNSTFSWVSMTGRTNLFLWARAYEDADGNGIPDWWEIQYFGTNGVDPYAECPSGDGWTILQAYQNSWDPFQFYTSPPPQNVTASLDATGTNVVLTWRSGGGPVTNYAISHRYYSTVGEVGASTFSFTTSPGDPIIGSGAFPPIYSIRANFSNGSFADSPWVSPANPTLDSQITFMRGPTGHLYFAMASPQPSMSRVVFFWNDYEGSSGSVAVYPTNLINGVAAIPELEPHFFWLDSCQVLATNGQFSDRLPFSYYFPEAPVFGGDWTLLRFVDARPHLKENLKFLLRSATLNSPFSYAYDRDLDPDFLFSVGYYLTVPESRMARPASPSSYEYYGFHSFSQAANHSVLGEWRPVDENYLWRNMAYDPADFSTSGGWTNGTDYSRLWPNVRLLENPKYYFTDTGTNAPPLAFSSANYDWLFARWAFWDTDVNFISDLAEAGLLLSANHDLSLPNGVSNVFGLTLLTEKATALTTNFTLSAGGSAHHINDYIGCFPQAQEPGLRMADYYFASQTPYFNYIASVYEYDPTNPAPPLPGAPSFSVTNSSPLLITSIGQPMTVTGWAKMAITNGYSDKFAYLEQYFDKAYQIGTNGADTNKQTGLLSPYGEFFPTEPGPTALRTMPDIDTGQRGTGVVNVIKLQLDVNHDGIMDLTFGGPDNTSQTRPFVFWINNDNDGTGIGQDIEVLTNSTADYQFGRIRSQRNLEDFARLWICGLPQLPASQGYTITMTMTPSSGNPAINLYAAVTNSAAYLSDPAAATNQFTQYLVNGQVVFDFAKKLGTIDSSQSYTLPVSSDGTPQYTNFLFEGAGIGAGQLTLTISQTTFQGSNVLAQTSAWLDLHDVKDFYERAVITNNTTGAISNWSSAIERVQQASASALGDDTNVIVLVHGINVSPADWLIESDTVFKRLYWSGYYGKFAAVKWPCEFFKLWTLLSEDFMVFNRSEIRAYKASSAAKTYIDRLHAQLPGYRMHLLAHSQGNAVVSEAIEQGAAFDTYILTQGALPANAYDVNAPIHTGLSNSEAIYGPTPEWRSMGYRGAYTNLTGRIINFYNTNDPVLAVWINDQGAAKPNLSSTDYHYNGTTATYAPPFGSSYTVTDPQESRAYVSRSRTFSIGQSPPESQHGVIQSAIDLKARFGFNNAFPGDHSAQWVRPIQTTRDYYLQILDSINP